MNKGLRNEITRRIFLRRVRLMRTNTENTAFKHQSRPCNCWMCRQPRWSKSDRRDSKKIKDWEL